MKGNLLHFGIVFLIVLYALPALAQLNGTGYYIIRNAQYDNHYISIANDKLIYSTIVNSGGGANNLARNTNTYAPYAFNCVDAYLRNDIHMNTTEYRDPAQIVYLKKGTEANAYNIIGQGTSILALTTGMYDGSGGDIFFQDLWVKIRSAGGSGANTLYTASILLKARVVAYVGFPISSNAELGTRYFTENSEGKFAISESSDTDSAKWKVEKITYFNVPPPYVEYNGKYYTTLKVPFECSLGNNVEKAYVIHAVNSGSLDYEEITGTIPAGTPVILQCSSNSPAECTMNLPANHQASPPACALDTGYYAKSAPAANEMDYYVEAGNTNLLKGTYYRNTDGNVPYVNYKNVTANLSGNHYTTYNRTYNPSASSTGQKYILGINANGNLGFVKATSTNPAPSGILPANKAWMTVEGEFAVAKPTFDPTAGTKNNPLYVTINCATTGATIYYTTDGTDPTTSGTRQEYTGPVYVKNTTTIKAYAVLGDGNGEGLFNNTSAVASAKYTLKVATPTFDPPAGNYSSPQTVTINCATEGATIYYTLDGSTPSNKKTLYTGPITVDHDMTIKAIAYNSPMSASAVGTAAYTFPKIIASPSALTINEDGGSFTVTGSHLITNVSVTPSTDFSTTIESEVNTIEPWGFVSNEGSVDGTVNVTYQGRSLNTQGSIDLGTEGLSISVPVTYIPDIYIVTDNGIQNQWNYNGAKMAYNDGIYTATFTAPLDNTFILFARKASLGDNERWGTRYVFGPNSGGDWVMPNSSTANGTIDVNDDDPIQFTQAGTYFITIDATDANNPTFTIARVPEKTLAEIESTGTVGSRYVVSDELIGAWAVGNILWAKDQGQQSIDKRPAKADYQTDYERTHKMHHDNITWTLQKGEWDESNWVALDFSNLTGVSASSYVGKKISGIKGTYSDNQNFRIDLSEVAEPIEDESLVGLYPSPGNMPNPAAFTEYGAAFNSYLPANFYTSNQNKEIDGTVVGVLTHDTQDANNPDSQVNLYFMNPKIQEVARIWGVWNGSAFTVSTNLGNNFDPIVDGAVSAIWDYNPRGVVNDLQVGEAYIFHAVVGKNTSSASNMLMANYQHTPSNSAPSADYVIYPLDFASANDNWTAVKEVMMLDHQVKSVTYFDIMGRQSDKPFEGINIVVTRYTDGSTSTMKVIR